MLELYIAFFAVPVLALLFGLLLGLSSIKFKVESDPIVDQIDAILPQTQCGQCGYPGCRPYAEAIANGDSINKCPPGGQACIEKLANLMGVEATEPPCDEMKNIKKVAYIHEKDCIGCTKCIQACPVDAIVGSTKAMHTVIKDECTGCDLCVAPCPTNCIEMRPKPSPYNLWGSSSNTIAVVNISDEEENGKKPV